MIRATVTAPDGRILATWTSAGDDPTGDPLFLAMVANWRAPAGEYLPYPELTAIVETAKAVGCKVEIEGEEDPIPPDAVH